MAHNLCGVDVHEAEAEEDTEALSPVQLFQPREDSADQLKTTNKNPRPRSTTNKDPDTPKRKAPETPDKVEEAREKDREVTLNSPDDSKMPSPTHPRMRPPLY